MALRNPYVSGQTVETRYELPSNNVPELAGAAVCPPREMRKRVDTGGADSPIKAGAVVAGK